MAPRIKKETADAAAAVKKEPVKRAAVKKTAEVYVQWFGQEASVSDITARIQNMWKNDMKRKVSELKDLRVYIKPEEGKAHYVINQEISGSIDL